MITVGQLTDERPATVEDAASLALQVAFELEEDALAQLSAWETPEDLAELHEQLQDARLLRANATRFVNGHGIVGG